MSDEAEKRTSWRKLAIACVYAVGAGITVFLLTQHWVHVSPFLPLLILLSCPVMHLFMHHGHGGHGSHGGREAGPPKVSGPKA
jgi:hypothetical protein